MNWQRALNVFIGIFLLINLVLFVYIQHEVDARHQVDPEAKRQLHAILAENDMKLEDFLPDFYPMAELEFLMPEVDREAVLASVFSMESYKPAPNQTSAFRYVSDKQELIFHTGNSRGLVTYSAQKPVFVPSDYSEATMTATAEAFAKVLMAEKVELVLTDVRPSGDGSFHILEFNERYKGSLLFSNYVIVKIDRNGVQEAKAMRYQPTGIGSPKEQVVPADQVLYKFMAKYGKPGMAITALDLGYDLKTGEIATGNKVTLIPYYRIKTDSGAFYYVGAYDNRIYTEMR